MTLTCKAVNYKPVFRILTYRKHHLPEIEIISDPASIRRRINSMFMDTTYYGDTALSPSSGDSLTQIFCGPTLARQNKNCADEARAHISVDYSGKSHEDLLVLVASQKDRKAFAILFSHFGPRVKSYLLKMGMGNSLAEDIAQEVMVRMWEKAESFNPQKARVSTWLFRIARNKFIDHTRKHKYPEVDADKALQNKAADSQTDEQTLARQQAEVISKAMEKLSPEQREAVAVSFYQDMTHKEVSEKLSIPLGTVKSRLRLAFNILRKELEHTK